MKESRNTTGQFNSRAGMIAWFMRGSMRFFVLSVVFSCVVSLADLIAPKIIQYTADSVIGSEPLNAPGAVLNFVERIGGIAYLREHLGIVATTRNLVVLLSGVSFVIRGRMTTGGLIAFISYNALISLPVRSLGRVITEMSKAGVSIDRLRSIMNAKEEEYGTPDPQRDSAYEEAMRGTIRFEQVSFGFGADGAHGAHGANGKSVLKDVTFAVPAGRTVGILGATGSGKSTLLALLDRLYDLPEDGGTITIGGKDIREIPLPVLRRNIGLVLQEPYLFSGTLAENIGIAREGGTGQTEGSAPGEAGQTEGSEPGDAGQTDDTVQGEMRMADPEAIRRASRIACLDGDLKQFPRGYETYVGERGVTLSSGQKQRAAIAQMLIRDTPIMAFDDSLSAVDADTDRRIREALEKETAGATVLIVAHRITTLMHADEILVLQHGRIVQRGTHRQLAARDGIYREIYELQTRDAYELQTRDAYELQTRDAK